MHESEAQLEWFVESIAASQPALRAYILSMVRRPDAVDDVLQETNLALWRRRGDYDPQRPFRTWACGVAHYQTLAYFKRAKRASSSTLSESVMAEIGSEAARQAEQMDDRLAALRVCMGRLPDNQRQIIDARYAAARGVQQIARELSQSETAVSSVLYRARQALMRCIERTLAGEAEA